MTTPDAVPAPDPQAASSAPGAAPLSAFLGGWARAQQSRPLPSHAAGGGPASQVPQADGAHAQAEQPQDTVLDEEHVFEVADPRDFADDAGPQYEDEDFDAPGEGDGVAAGAPSARLAPAEAPATTPAPAEAEPASAPSPAA
ncbi:MAG: hypothetical protein Q605_AUC00984G0004, partial [Actinomyces urogenitalis DORA_12]